MRLALLSPLPPAATGIADYSADVLQLLADHHSVDAYHAQPHVDRDRLPSGCGVYGVASFRARHAASAYDLVIYQMGNSPHHDFLYEYLRPVPGLLVLHELVLHHARARMFLDSPAVRAYALDPSSAARRAEASAPLAAYHAEVAYSYPAQADRLAETQLATVGDLLPYAYPLSRIPVEASRLTAVHNDFMLEALTAEIPGAEVVRIPMLAPATDVPPGAARALRQRHGIAEQAFVVGCFGLLTREKRVDTVARAVARAAWTLPEVHLWLVGPVPDAGALSRMLSACGVAQRVTVTGRVPFSELPAHVEAADLAVHLRYPTARETSAALLRLLAQGRPTLVSDLEHLADVPGDAVLRADPTDEEGDVLRAILRLASRPEARARLGERAAAFAHREHSEARCREGYEAAIARATALPAPEARPWPAHWLAS